MVQDTTDTGLYSLAAALGAALQERGWSVSTVESCTGGGLAAAITEVPGSSQWFELGLVTYANQAKTRWVGVDASLLAAHGAVSGEVAGQMAQGALAASGADLALSITGIAGPDGGSADKPVGTVWHAWAWTAGHLRTESYVYEGARGDVRRQAVVTALRGALNICRHGDFY